MIPSALRALRTSSPCPFPQHPQGLPMGRRVLVAARDAHPVTRAPWLARAVLPCSWGRFGFRCVSAR
eukprot:3022624-Alexandrium_andersonii.AAC.1